MLAPSGLTMKVALVHRFLQRKGEEYDAMREEIEALKTEVGEIDGYDRI